MACARSRWPRAAAPRDARSRADPPRAAVKPRPALLFVLSYGAGLATGLLRFGSPLSAVMLLAAGFVVRQPIFLLLVTATALGRAAGELAWVTDGARCAALLPPGRSRLTVRLVDPVG